MTSKELDERVLNPPHSDFQDIERMTIEQAIAKAQLDMSAERRALLLKSIGENM